jgi:hypothetical protein
MSSGISSGGASRQLHGRYIEPDVGFYFYFISARPFCPAPQVVLGAFARSATNHKCFIVESS